MPKVSRDSATQGGEFGPVVDRSDHLEGYTVNFTSFHEDVDATPLLKGLPDDRCQCPHWGYVVNGKLTFRYAQRDAVQRTLLEAAVRLGQYDLARALSAERLAVRETSVYGWMQRARVLPSTGDRAGAQVAVRRAQAAQLGFVAALTG